MMPIEEMNKIPEGWEACSIEEAQKAWTPWCSCADICRNSLNTWVSTRRLCYIYLEDWEDLGIIPIRKVKPEPFEKVVTAYRFGKYVSKFRISAQVPREGKYRVVEVVE